MRLMKPHWSPVRGTKAEHRFPHATNLIRHARVTGNFVGGFESHQSSKETVWSAYSGFTRFSGN